MITNKKIMVLTTTDDMIWHFLIPHIKHLQSLGNIVECVCAKTGFWFDELKNKHRINMHEINFTRSPLSFKNIKGFKALKKLQKQKKFDFIYCQQPVGGVMGRRLAKKFKLPCIYTAHGFHFFKGNSKVKNFIFKSIEKHYAKYTTALITINKEDYNAAKDWKAKHIYKINGIGVNFDKYKPDPNLNKEDFRKSFGLEKDDFVVLSVGELNKNKNTLRLLKCIKSLNIKNIKYFICGQGPLKQQYEAYIKDNNLQQNVKMIGYRTDISNFYSIADLYIMPSFREGLSKSMMEAMCYGLPVVASRIRGNVDLLGEGEGGILCNPNHTEEFTEAIKKMYEDENLRKQFANRNLEYVKKFDLEVVKKQLKEIYINLC